MDDGRWKEVMDEMKQCFLYHVFTVIFAVICQGRLYNIDTNICSKQVETTT